MTPHYIDHGPSEKCLDGSEDHEWKRELADPDATRMYQGYWECQLCGLVRL